MNELTFNNQVYLKIISFNYYNVYQYRNRGLIHGSNIPLSLYLLRIFLGGELLLSLYFISNGEFFQDEDDKFLILM
jgi:hypothetical protein